MLTSHKIDDRIKRYSQFGRIKLSKLNKYINYSKAAYFINYVIGSENESTDIAVEYSDKLRSFRFNSSVKLWIILDKETSIFVGGSKM